MISIVCGHEQCGMPLVQGCCPFGHETKEDDMIKRISEWIWRRILGLFWR